MCNWLRRLNYLRRRDRFAEDLREEINLHVELRARQMHDRNAATVALLTAVALLASLIPARRGASVDPMAALRNE